MGFCFPPCTLACHLRCTIVLLCGVHLCNRQELLVDFRHDHVIRINHLGQVDLGNFGKQLVGIEFRQPIVRVNPMDEFSHGDADGAAVLCVDGGGGGVGGVWRLRADVLPALVHDDREVSKRRGRFEVAAVIDSRTRDGVNELAAPARRADDARGGRPDRLA